MTLQNDNFIVQGRQTFLWLSAVLLEIYKKKMQRACRIDWLLEGGGFCRYKNFYVAFWMQLISILNIIEIKLNYNQN